MSSQHADACCSRAEAGSGSPETERRGLERTRDKSSSGRGGNRPSSLLGSGEQAAAGGDEVLIVLLYGTCQPVPGEIRKLGVGDVIRLDQPESAHVELMLGGCRFAEGNLVRVEDRVGVKITNIVSRQSARYAA